LVFMLSVQQGDAPTGLVRDDNIAPLQFSLSARKICGPWIL
jgi:hypothetical protein